MEREAYVPAGDFEYNLYSKLGKGAFGTVYRGRKIKNKSY